MKFIWRRLNNGNYVSLQLCFLRFQVVLSQRRVIWNLENFLWGLFPALFYVRFANTILTLVILVDDVKNSYFQLMQTQKILYNNNILVPEVVKWRIASMLSSQRLFRFLLLGCYVQRCLHWLYKCSVNQSRYALYPP